MCVFFSCKLQGGEPENGVGGVLEGGQSGCPCVWVIKEEGDEEGLPQSRETGGWARGTPRSPCGKSGPRAAI